MSAGDNGSEQRAARSVGGAAFVALGIFLSRIIGLVRERVFAHYFGSSMAAGAFKAALRIPNALQNLFGEGVLSGSLIPVYARLIAEGDERQANRVAGAVASFLALFVAVIAAGGVLLSGPIVTVIAPGLDGEARDLTIRIVRILFPGMGLLVMSAWCLGVLNSHRRFFIPYVAPVLWSLAMIAAMVGFGGRADQERLAIILAWGTVAGSVLQFGIQIPFVLQVARGLKFGFDRASKPVRTVFSNAVPIVVSRGVVQISAFVDEMIGSLLGVQALAGIAYAQTIYMLPVSLFAMSVAAAELPEMSSALGTTEEVAAKLRERIVAAQRRVSFLVVPSVVAFLSIGMFLVGGLYQTGAFRRAETLYVAYILAGYSLGLFAVTLGRLYSSAFYALRDTRTPLRFAVLRVVLAAGLGLTFAFPLRPLIVALIDRMGLPVPGIENAPIALGAVGLTGAAGIAGWLEFMLLRRALAGRIGPTPLEAGFQARVWTAALVAGGAAAGLGYPFLEPFMGTLPIGRGMHRIVSAIVVAGVFGLVYVGIALVMRVPETRILTRVLRRK